MLIAILDLEVESISRPIANGLIEIMGDCSGLEVRPLNDRALVRLAGR